jgi:predicted RNase H-like HicB family nuclease
MNFTIEFEQETEGRWIAEVIGIPGAMVYGKTKDEASAKVQALAFSALAEQLEHQEASPDLVTISFNAA